ncbi:receptor-like protein 6 [Vicia villosa]|uniref:receptor-like protein 6 n=1 Tax=Vicia villosa TaxID=3911 RepID=UPI00273ACB52|nr:receptor-like protein 6 [Vicia villosa]
MTGPVFKSLIFCLPSVQELDLSYNAKLFGQLPKFNCSASLKILDLSWGRFQGSIPFSYSNLTHLTSLDLSLNHLNGSIPSSLLTLPHLTALYLNDNDLNGQIPNEFPLTNKFQLLNLGHNNIKGEMPSSLSNLQHLTHMCLHLLLFNLPSFSSSFNFSCHHDEYYALLQFKSSFTIGASYFMDETYIPKTTTWNNKTNCCAWQGVKCDIISGPVTGINLFSESLQGM